MCVYLSDLSITQKRLVFVPKASRATFLYRPSCPSFPPDTTSVTTPYLGTYLPRL